MRPWHPVSRNVNAAASDWTSPTRRSPRNRELSAKPVKAGRWANWSTACAAASRRCSRPTRCSTRWTARPATSGVRWRRCRRRQGHPARGISQASNHSPRAGWPKNSPSCRPPATLPSRPWQRHRTRQSRPLSAFCLLSRRELDDGFWPESPKERRPRSGWRRCPEQALATTLSRGVRSVSGLSAPAAASAQARPAQRAVRRLDDGPGRRTSTRRSKRASGASLLAAQAQRVGQRRRAGRPACLPVQLPGRSSPTWAP